MYYLVYLRKSSKDRNVLMPQSLFISLNAYLYRTWSRIRHNSARATNPNCNCNNMTSYGGIFEPSYTNTHINTYT